MRWFKDTKRYWRAVFLVLLVIAIFGPWAFDKISVPQPYTCSWPNVRLDDRFCGSPTAISWLLAAIPATLASLINNLITGSASQYAAAEWLFVLVSMLLVLPFVSTSVLLLREERRRWLRIHGAVLGLAGAIGLLLGMSGFSRVSWMLWGLWLYTFATIAMCVLEVSILRTPEKSVEE